MQKLLDIMKALRDPESGCPWDIEQNFKSIAPYTIEEAYEVADAIEKNDMDALKGELGDLLLQVVFHAQMAADEHLFDFDAVVEEICNKLVRRHPHVFGGDGAHSKKQSKAAVRESWQSIKQKERQSRGVLDDIPRALPALKKAQKIGSRASGIGFDWTDWTGAADKLEEELGELRVALKDQDKKAQVHEVGDVLFSVVNLCRHLNIDAEAALNETSARFRYRFAAVEDLHRESTSRGQAASLGQMEAAWKSRKTF